jgi:SulP family sulfate permease
MNHELIAHGYSNCLAGLMGGLQNYLCYSNSLLYHKCNGGGVVSGYLLCAATAMFFLIGPDAVYYVPRAMPGCLLIHIGIDLTEEALGVDSLTAFDFWEYSSVVAITLVMTLFGMTEGLALGVFCAALTFTLQVCLKYSRILLPS